MFKCVDYMVVNYISIKHNYNTEIKVVMLPKKALFMVPSKIILVPLTHPTCITGDILIYTLLFEKY